MKKKIKFYRVVLNSLFYVFYVLVISILFSFVFPMILVLLGKPVLDPSSPIFTVIQILILIFVFILSLSFRKYLYLPIFSEEVIIEKKEKVKEVESKQETISKSEKTEESIEIKLEDEIVNENIMPELDIKIGKEIK
ncbi:MAG: hypothetical protein PHS49_00035 [Candidatus Gracilibacteria bacterium]|nr:hypothetical protein [Candidatus Gracilibacteria bacterium]